MRVRVLIRPKAGILDPQGKAVERRPAGARLRGVANVHVGRLVELDVASLEEAEQMCERLLAEHADRGLRSPAGVKFGVLQFPGSCDDRDAAARLRRASATAVMLWHGDRDLQGVDAVVVPGGFSYGDYLRAGAIARFSPVMESVIAFANDGGLVLGICNGFQVLCEAHLLPGALLPNTELRFVCRQVELEVVDADTPFTNLLRAGRACCRSRPST